ncbi:LAO/AO transport system ATPase, partial [Opisthorchis viverrini]
MFRSFNLSCLHSLKPCSRYLKKPDKLSFDGQLRIPPHTSTCGSRFFRSISDDFCVPNSIRELKERLFAGDRRSLAQSITLIESKNPDRRREGQYILSEAMNYLAERETRTGTYTFRVGLSGPPGAGKSTFIEALGTRLIGLVPWVSDLPEQAQKGPYGKRGSNEPVPVPTENHRVAVLAVDPSSVTTGGSLLADKTRMYELSRHENAYVRPSPSGGNLGGVARSTNETVLICEAAGFDVVLVETVGESSLIVNFLCCVGQSEIAVADMVDLFILLIPPAGGDELQGIKRGIVEYADIVVVNKADGDLIAPARRIAAEYSNALKYQRMRRPNWRPQVMLASSYTGAGIVEFWNRVLEFKEMQIASKELQSVRKKQMKVSFLIFPLLKSNHREH